MVALTTTETGTAFTSWKEMRLAIRKEASRTIRENPNDGLWRIITRVEEATKGWNVNGYVRARTECTLAVKALVLVGRCRNHGEMRMAFWMPKKNGPLRDARCVHCGHPLGQTTLALNAHFAPLFPTVWP